jgi:hypothetical protein
MVILRWFVGLCLPSLLLGILIAGILVQEYHNPFLTVRLGEWLLRDNRQRQPVGAVWQGILASRRSRDVLENRRQDDSLQLTSLPKALLRSRFTMERASAELLIMASRERNSPLSARQIGRTQMQELAQSLQYFQLGQALLEDVRLSRESFRTHAYVRAQIALDDGTIYPQLHAQLHKINSPEAWNFVKMSPEDEQHWRGMLRSYFSPSESGGVAAVSESPLAVACTAVVQNLTESLYSAEVDRLQRTWRFGGEMQIRLAGRLEEFAGYIVLQNQPPVAVAFPRDSVTPIIGEQVKPDRPRP